jgi:hypothetical protein
MKGERPLAKATRRLEQDILREDAQFYESFTTACDQLDPRTTRPHPHALRTGTHIHWDGLKPIVLWAIVAIIGPDYSLGLLLFSRCSGNWRRKRCAR